MIEFEPIEAHRSPHPKVLRFECHPKGAVAQDVDGIRCIGSLTLVERPSYSSAATEGVLDAVPETIAFERHVVDEDLHPSDEPHRHFAGRVSSHKDWMPQASMEKNVSLRIEFQVLTRKSSTPVFCFHILSWMGNLLFKLMYRKKPENDKYREQIDSSAGIVVFSCTNQTKAHWVDVGRAYQRFALHSTAHGIQHSFINQPVEVPELRSQLASYLELGDKLPDLIIRFGYGDPSPRTLRRPVDQVII